MARRQRHEEHENHESWAIPYGDLVTLLLAFFVVMYSISSVNSGKYRVLSDSLTAAFRGTPRSPQPIAVGALVTGVGEQMPIGAVNRLMAAGLPSHLRMPLPEARGDSAEGESNPGSADPRQEASNLLAEAKAARARELSAIAADVSGVLSGLLSSNEVQVHKLDNAVEVQISADVLFASGMAEPAPAAVPVLERLATALKPWPNAVQVEGHTDDVPVRGGPFRSNWELSGARAGSVVRLFAEQGVDPQRLAVVGYGQYRPLQSNDSAAGRNANRRVAVIILGAQRAGAPLRP